MIPTKPTITRTEKRRRKRIGLANKGRYHGRSILTIDDVYEIRSKLKRGRRHNIAEIAEKYGVSPRTITRIKYRHSFKYLKARRK